MSALLLMAERAPSANKYGGDSTPEIFQLQEFIVALGAVALYSLKLTHYYFINVCVCV